MAVFPYNTNPDLNTSIGGADISEGCNPDEMNNATRQLMADIAAFVGTGGETHYSLRALVVPDGETGPTVPAIASRKNKVLLFDNTGLAGVSSFTSTYSGANALMPDHRTVMAAFTGMADGQAAALGEDKREGLFFFDTANRSAQVTADPNQGLYVAPASDTTGASGAWVRRLTGPLDPEWFGAAGDGVTNDTTAIAAMLSFAGSQSLKHVAFRRGSTYLVSTNVLAISANDLTVSAYGAIITTASTASEPLLTLSGSRVKIKGGTWQITSGSVNPWFFNVTGTDCEIDNVRGLKTPDAGGYHAYFRSTADGALMLNSRWEGSNGFYVECSNAAFIGNNMTGRAAGGDDGFALKSITDVCQNIIISNNRFEKLASGLSIGSEIGVLGANDANYTRAVRNVVFANNTLKDCYGIAYLKPGAISDYRDGTVEDITISNNILTDLAGTKFERGIAITPSRGARIRNVRGSGNIIRARTVGGIGRLIGALDILMLNDAGGTVACSVSGIEIGIDYSDVYDGQSNAGGRPGFPAANIVNINRSGAVGTVSDVVLDIRGNGSSEAGMLVAFGLTDNQIRIKRMLLTNVNRTNPAGQGGAYIGTPIQMEGSWVVTPAAGSELAFTDASLTPEYGRGGFNTPKTYQIGGANVLTGIGAAIADAGGAAAAPTQAEFNALAATVNAILLRMRNATPTIAV